MRADSSFRSVPGAHLHGDLVEAERIQLAPEVDVRDDIEVFAQREVLKYRGDAEIERRARIRQRDLLAAEGDRASAGLMDTG